MMTEAAYASEENIRQRLQKNLDIYNSRWRRPYTISIKIGMAIYDPDEPRSLDELLVEADAKMRRYKQEQPKGE